MYLEAAITNGQSERLASVRNFVLSRDDVSGAFFYNFAAYTESSKTRKSFISRRSVSLKKNGSKDYEELGLCLRTVRKYKAHTPHDFLNSLGLSY